MALLTFNTKYIVNSQTSANTISTTLVDDTPSLYGGTGQITLTATQTVLVFYQANNTYGVDTDTKGIKNAISINGVDKAISADSGYIIPGNCMRNMCFWVGSLGAGTHTIKGRFASIYGSTVTINNRILMIYVLNGDNFQYIDDNNPASTNSNQLQDDIFAPITVSPTENCKVLVMYNASQNYLSNGWFEGMKIAINTIEPTRGIGTDYSQAQKNGYSGPYPISIFTCYAHNLNAGITKTYKGRFASNQSPFKATIDNRQFAVLLFDNNTQLDFITNNKQVNTSSNVLKDDIYAIIEKNQIKGELLVIGTGTKRYEDTSNRNGICYGISVDGVDNVNSRGSDRMGRADSASVCWGQTLTEGSHIVQGRFSNNTTNGDNALINSRHIACLWLYTGPYTYTKTIGIGLSNNISLTKNISIGSITMTLNNSIVLTKYISLNKLITMTLNSSVGLTKFITKTIQMNINPIVNLIRTLIRLPANIRIYRIDDSIENVYEIEDEITNPKYENKFSR